MELRHGFNLFVPLILVIFSTNTMGMFFIPDPVPIERLVNNTQAYIEEHPDDPSGHYTLGRIHYMAYVMKSDKLRAYEPDEVDRPTYVVAGDHLQDWDYSDVDHEVAQRRVLERYGVKDISGIPLEQISRFFAEVGKESKNMRQPDNPNLNAKQQQEHMLRAIDQLRKAAELDPKAAAYPMTLASALDMALNDEPTLLRLAQHDGDDATLSTEKADAEAVATRYTDQAIANYWSAFQLAKEDDLERDTVFDLSDLISYESGLRYADLVKQRGPTDEETARLEEIETHLTQFDRFPNAVTPIVFALKPIEKLERLLDSEQTVHFDLDGDGLAESRTWIKPDTALLVWDPDRTECINSGRQLFGNVTWWLFWRDGYHALDALDDNRDGELVGRELEGIAAWFDRNTNGVSDEGEVASLSSLGVTGIATKATGYEGASPMNPRGLRMRDGSQLPTWDWIAEPVAEGETR